MTIFDEKFKKNFKKLKEISKNTKGDVFRKKMKEALEKPKEAPVRKTTGKPELKNIMQMEKSLENLMKDERFPKKEKPPIEFKRRQPPNPPSRVPGEQKEMQPLSKGGRAGFKSGSKGCKLAMKGKGRAYGKNS
jgi:hypothetical protein